jgi:hypothetical protein
VDISVVRGDALDVAADVLILKHAQALYGVDAKVVSRLERHGIDLAAPGRLPSPGAFRLVESGGLLGAAAVLFIGVAELGRFGYAEIREFARRSLAVLADTLPAAIDVAMTTHGAGFGLDETEAFRAEVAGIVEALESAEHPKMLRRIVIVEHDAGRVQRLQRQLDEIFPGGIASIRSAMQQPAMALQSDALRTAGAESRAKAHVFVAMPFAKEFDDRFHYGIHTAIRSAGYLCERADMASFVGDVLAWVKDRIDTADLVVADLTGANPNVYLEVGYAWGRGLPTILLASDEKDLLFDVRGQRCLVYMNSIRTLEQQLTNELAKLAAPAVGTRMRRP